MRAALGILTQKCIGTTGFTILELIVVVVILAIVAVVSLPAFNKIKENSIDQEAIANLKLIQGAEKIYKLETNVYFNATNTTTFNQYLRISLPTSSAYWNYKSIDATANIFTAKAQRAGGDNRVIWINQSLNTTVSGGSW